MEKKVDLNKLYEEQEEIGHQLDDLFNRARDAVRKTEEYKILIDKYEEKSKEIKEQYKKDKSS